MIQARCDGMGREQQRLAEEETYLTEILNQQRLKYQELKVRAAGLPVLLS